MNYRKWVITFTCKKISFLWKTFSTKCIGCERWPWFFLLTISRMVVFPVCSAVFVHGKFLGYHEEHPPWGRTANFLLRKLHRGKRFLKTYFTDFRNGQSNKGRNKCSFILVTISACDVWGLFMANIHSKLHLAFERELRQLSNSFGPLKYSKL